MWVFLATEILFFGGLFLRLYDLPLRLFRRFAEASRHTDMLRDGRDGSAPDQQLPDLPWAVTRDQAQLASIAYSAACCRGAWHQFLAMHGFEYYKEYHEHLIPGIDFRSSKRSHAQAVELFFCLYYFITGFHSLHVLLGVTLILVLAARVRRGAFGPQRYTTPDTAPLLALGRYRLDLPLSADLSAWTERRMRFRLVFCCSPGRP